MEINWSEWLNLVLRWFHVVAAISWIGSSFYFMWLDKNLEAPPTDGGKDSNVAGSLWMVHSGGFYHVEKRHLAAGQVPPKLHWFKYEALFTGITGYLLLVVVYHLGGAAVDAGTAQNEWVAFGVATASLIACWEFYDRIWVSPLGQKPQLTAAICFVVLIAVNYGLGFFLSTRAAYIYTGAIMGICMVGNVWERILPAQREMIAATQAGKPRDPTLAQRAKARSVHNNYMTLPVVFIMISNHFPSTYGNDRSWLVLAFIMLAGAGVRHHMNTKRPGGIIVVILSIIAIATLCSLT